MNAVTNATINEQHGENSPGAHGISIYFPTSSSDWSSKYPGSAGFLIFTQQSRWDEFLQAHLAYGVGLSPATQWGLEAAGATVTYFQGVQNTGLNNDSYDLALSGNMWPTTIWNETLINQITNTGIVTSTGYVYIALQVQIPSGAGPGDFDTAILRTTSVNGPDISATVPFTTAVLGGDILLVDDDSDCYGLTDVGPHYRSALAHNGYPYDYWDVCSAWRSPDLAALQQYEVVIWFTGGDYEDTLSPSDEGTLISYLDGGGTLFFSAQDYLYDVGELTSFGQNYLHISSYNEDMGASTVTGVGGNPVGDGLGPYTLRYPFADYSDEVTPDEVSSAIFTNDYGNPCALTASGSSKTVFFAFPFEALRSADADVVMNRVMSWLYRGAPALSIAKADTPDPVQAGGLLTYTLVVHNTGSADATGVTITDTIPASTLFAWAESVGSLEDDQVQWTGETVNAGGDLAVTFVVTVNSALPDGTIITNDDYGVTCAEGVSAAGSLVSTTVQSAPVLSISKADTPDPVQAGGLLTYTSVVHNSGNADATGVSITDTIPANTVFASADSGGSLVGDRVQWTGKTVNAGGSLTVTFVVTVSSPLPEGSTITNADYGVTCAEGVSAVGSPMSTTVQSAPVLSISKADTPDPVQAGGLLTYTIVVHNTGSADATGVTITDTIPANTTFAWADSGGALVGDRVQWTGKTVNAGGSLTVTFVVTVSSPLLNGAIITNADYGVTCAEGVSAAGSPVTTTVQSAPILSIAKADTPDPVEAGGLLTYTVVVHNSGSADATSASITDTIPVNTTLAWADSGGALVGDQVQWTGKTVALWDFAWKGYIWGVLRLSESAIALKVKAKALE